MPCPAKELGEIVPFDAIFVVISERQRQNIFSGVVRGWRTGACGAFGHGMPCPYCRKSAKSPAGGQRVRKPEAKAKEPAGCRRYNRTTSRRAPSNAIVLRDSLAQSSFSRAAYRRTLCYLAFASWRRLGPGLKVQVVFQGRTCTFALAVENYSRRGAANAVLRRYRGKWYEAVLV